MNTRRFFINRSWWGKLLGALFGFLMAGPAGAFFGILVGNFFDRGLSQNASPLFLVLHKEKNKHVRALFFDGLFSTLGYIAKADGRVSEKAIEFAKQIMHEMSLNAHQRKAAQVCFNAGKKIHFDLHHTLIELYAVLRYKPLLLKLFVNTQYRAIQIDGASQKKWAVMNTILSYMHLAPLNQQYQFYTHFNQETPNSGTYREQSHHRTSTQPTSLDSAYLILGVTSSATQTEVKRAYRRLMSQHHPDKLIAKKASAALIQKANEKTQAISKAYESICEYKGW